MKYLNLSFFLLVFLIFSCQKDSISPSGECYKGKIILNGICSNITIQITEGNMNPNLYEKEWLNEANNVTYNNVFRLLNVCSFPSNIKEGQEFSFRIIEKNDTNCAVCLAYYPTPSKGLNIEICD